MFGSAYVSLLLVNASSVLVAFHEVCRHTSSCQLEDSVSVTNCTKCCSYAVCGTQAHANWKTQYKRH